ncbi:MAG: ASCH domain-containing protein [Streptomycetales bacterium]
MAEPNTHERTINIRKSYLELIAHGTKTIEVRVAYPSMRKITAGQVLRFTSEDRACRTQVTKVAEYPSFEAMLDVEDVAAIGGWGMTQWR